MHWGTFKYVLEQVTKNLLKNSFACKIFFRKKDVQSFSNVIHLAPSYEF
jgi:hypothetical protein